jgi:hypothetical protein
MGLVITAMLRCSLNTLLALPGITTISIETNQEIIKRGQKIKGHLQTQRASRKNIWRLFASSSS